WGRPFGPPPQASVTNSRMPKAHQILIIVWSLACVSGLGIFLFQIYGPAITPQTGYDGRGLTFAVSFFVFLWAVPVGVVYTLGRRQKSR
ncbi:MAG: hypothetical protein AB1760_18730, partial [Pseudomonadota bacterium]